METLTKKTATKKATLKNASEEINNAILTPKLNLLSEAKKNTKKDTPKGIQFNYANNVNGLNALISVENQSLGFQLSKIIEVYNKFNTTNEIEFTKNIKKKDKETGLVTIEAKKYIIKFCPLQMGLVQRMKKDSELYKYFATLCRKTKSGGFNLYYTLQSVNKYQKELQEFTIQK